MPCPRQYAQSCWGPDFSGRKALGKDQVASRSRIFKQNVNQKPERLGNGTIRLIVGKRVCHLGWCKGEKKYLRV